ncbi:HEAT repeat domain-containing protein [Rufibacter sp. DG15C]|uniref:HEAT repeat domain-containing protein n=1 Tax=Rufibacter sp. DG15C TaxID=1379909 RepID=UPI0012FA2EA1|nr:HEAT repeat domain-containing protein [Rufibacter sp. DG15C]
MIILITVFFVLTVAMLIAVLASRFYKLAVQANAERLRKRYELLLMHVLFFDEDKPSSDWDQDKIVQHFKKHYLKSGFKRKILIDEILDLNKNFTGQFAENLRLLFIYLNLQKDSFALLHNPRWNLKAQGICELAQMLVFEAAPYIKALINHSNDLVRMESHIALVKLEKQRGLSFLHQLHRTFTKWQQLNLQNALSKLDREDIPDFSEFLFSSNIEVVEFSAKMIGIYNQVNALPAIEALLGHPVEAIRLTAIETIRLLDAAQAVPVLLERFATDTKGNQVAILSAVASLGGAPNDFFAQQLLSGHHDLQLVAAKALHDLQELESYQVLEPQIQNAQLQQIIKHALDSRN